MFAEITSELVNPTTVIVALIWFVVGAVVTWKSRGLAAAIYLPALVLVGPTAVALGEEGGLDAMGAAGWVSSVIFPMVASVVGGHVMAVVNPPKRTARAAKAAEEVARRRALEIEQEISEIAQGASALGAPEAGSTVPSRLDVTLLRARLAWKEAELRDIRRTLGDTSTAA